MVSRKNSARSLDSFPAKRERPIIAWLQFDFYNGAMSTERCIRVIKAMEYIVAEHGRRPLSAVILMGGAYFGNGIALNVIEAAQDPSQESLRNIDAINRVVEMLW